MKKTISSENYLSLLKWLKTNRLEQSLTMRDLAVKLKVPHSFIGKVESAERRLDVQEYVLYCEALQINYQEGIELCLKDAIKKRAIGKKEV